VCYNRYPPHVYSNKLYSSQLLALLFGCVCLRYTCMQATAWRRGHWTGSRTVSAKRQQHTKDGKNVKRNKTDDIYEREKEYRDMIGTLAGYVIARKGRKK
jgi:hypothetical protein